MLLNLQENIFQNKYNSKNIHQYTNLLFFCFSCDYIDDHVGDNSHGDAFGNAVHKRHCDDCDKAWNSFCHIIKVDLCNRGQHQITNNDQGGCCSKRRKRANRIPEVRAVRPVRPPSATPEALSTKVVTVEVPHMAPTVVPTASESRAPLI